MARHKKTRRLLATLMTIAFAGQANTPPALAAGNTLVWETFTEMGAKLMRNGQLEDAEKALFHAIKEAEQFGPNNDKLLKSLQILASVYQKQGKKDEEAKLNQRIEKIEQHLKAAGGGAVPAAAAPGTAGDTATSAGADRSAAPAGIAAGSPPASAALTAQARPTQSGAPAPGTYPSAAAAPAPSIASATESPAQAPPSTSEPAATASAGASSSANRAVATYD
ncbi:MAG TPA: tetratricopeptide repeat protein, partial [Candidatus Obscuribacterales bacterium]